MRNLSLQINIILLGIFVLPTEAFAQISTNSHDNFVRANTIRAPSSAPNKAIIAFDSSKKASKAFSRALNTLRATNQAFNVEVIFANGKVVTLAQEGNVIASVNIHRYLQTHGDGFVVVAQDLCSQAINDLSKLKHLNDYETIENALEHLKKQDNISNVSFNATIF